MKKILSLFTFSVICSFLIPDIFAQAPTIEWQKTLGGRMEESAGSIFQTSDNGYIVAGKSSSTDGDVKNSRGGGDCWIVKLNSVGDTIWTKSLGGSSVDQATSIQQISDGYIMAGFTFSNDKDVSGNNGFLDMWIVKLNTTGGIIWQKCYGGTGIDYPTSIQQTSDGYIVAGTSASADGYVKGHHGAAGVQDAWILKLNTLGDTVWTKSVGGTDADFTSSIRQTIDGGYIFSGKSNSTDGDINDHKGTAESSDFWLVKLSASGSIDWQRSLGGTGDDAALSVQPTLLGYIAAGISASNDLDVSGHHGTTTVNDMWVVKLDITGKIIEWQKSFGGTADDRGTSVQQTSDGGYFVTGASSSTDGDVIGHHGTTATSDIWLLKLNEDGIIQWQKSIGGTADETSALSLTQQTGDGGYIVAGTTRSNDGDVTGNHGDKDFWVVKLAGVLAAPLETIENNTNVSLFPNPSSGKFTVDIQNNELRLEVYNLLGEMVLQQTSNEVDLSQNPAGLYTVKIIAGNKSYSKKVVVQ